MKQKKTHNGSKKIQNERHAKDLTNKHLHTSSALNIQNLKLRFSAIFEAVRMKEFDIVTDFV